MTPTEYVIDRMELFKRVVHQVRSPLSNIFDLADAMIATKKDLLDEQTLEDILAIQDSAQRSLSFFDAIVDLTSIEIMGPRGAHYGICVALDEATRQIKESLTARNQSLSVCIAPGLPDVWFDPEHIARITSIFLSHVSSVAPHGSEIGLSAYLDLAYITVSIGIGQGIATANTLKTVEIPSRDTKGFFALELLTVDRLLTLHHGGFWVSQDRNGNARYHFQVPVNGAEENRRENPTD